jgi:O-antigen/teichoic acid export membrane protein
VIAKLTARFKQYKLNDFYKSTISLSLTSFLSQFIIFVGTPLITRIYSPADFGDVSILSALIQFFGVFATLRYDNAIPLCDSDKEADILFLICTIFNFFFSATLFVILFILQHSGVHIFNLKNVNFIYFVPLGVSLYGFVNLLSFFTTRTHHFNKIGVSRVLQSITSIASQVGIGYSSVPILGPIVGYIFQIGFGVIYMSNIIGSKLLLLFKGVFTYSDFKEVSKKFVKFPKFSLLEALMQMFSFQLPYFYLNLTNNQSEAGFLMNSMKFSQIPMLLVASSISQVYYGHIKNNLDNGTLHPMATDILNKLYKLIVLPLLLFMPIAPFIFETYLGKSWRHSGELMQWIIPYTIALIIYAIFSVNFYAKEKFAASLKVQTIILVFRSGSLLISYLWFKQFTLEIYFASSAFIYFIFSGYALHIIKINAKDLSAILFKSKKLTFLAIIIFILLLFFFRNL